jgi:hypothetical protein
MLIYPFLIPICVTAYVRSNIHQHTPCVPRIFQLTPIRCLGSYIYHQTELLIFRKIHWFSYSVITELG